MTRDKHITEVVFRKWKDGTIDALFPYLTEFNYLVGCYSRVGQHGQADYDHVISKTSSATEDEYGPLKLELESLGYNVRVLKRANRDKMITHWRELSKR